MKHQNYYPTRQAKQAIWLENFRRKLPVFASALGLSAERVEKAVADARWLNHLLAAWLEAVRTHGKAATEALDLAQHGDGDVPLALPVFEAPSLPEGVVPQPSGALRRIFQLTAELRGHVACTAAMKADLGLEGPTEAGPDPASLRPEITATAVPAGVNIEWSWQGWSKYLDQCEIQVDRGDGQGWRILTFDTTPGYLDSTPAPATLIRWKYRAIYRADDAPFGDWSAEAVISLGGA